MPNSLCISLILLIYMYLSPFQMPIVDYKIPIRGLAEWFPDEHVLAKRDDLKELILTLQKELNPDLEYDPSQDTFL